jgi:hypothetical protein
MKAFIDQHGVLRVAADTPTEAYALQKWAEQNIITVQCKPRGAFAPSLEERTFVDPAHLIIDGSYSAEVQK